MDVNGDRGKPHREIRPGDRIGRRRAATGSRRELVVRGLAERSIPKAEARELYEDVTPPAAARDPRGEAARPPPRAPRRRRPARQAGPPGAHPLAKRPGRSCGGLTLDSRRGFRRSLPLLQRAAEDRSGAEGRDRPRGRRRFRASSRRVDDAIGALKGAGRGAGEEVRRLRRGREVQEGRPEPEIRGALREDEGRHVQAHPRHRPRLTAGRAVAKTSRRALRSRSSSC